MNRIKKKNLSKMFLTVLIEHHHYTCIFEHMKLEPFLFQ